MTTVAYDGTTLAADTLGCIGGYMKVRAEKLFQLVDGRLFGGAGDLCDVLGVVEWLNGGEKPIVEPFCALIVAQDGTYMYMDDSLMPVQLTEPFHAIGSGQDFAMAAMFLGRSAIEAVKVASHFDVFTGKEVMTLRVRKGAGESV